MLLNSQANSFTTSNNLDHIAVHRALRLFPLVQALPVLLNALKTEVPDVLAEQLQKSTFSYANTLSEKAYVVNGREDDNPVGGLRERQIVRDDLLLEEVHAKATEEEISTCERGESVQNVLFSQHSPVSPVLS